MSIDGGEDKADKERISAEPTHKPDTDQLRTQWQFAWNWFQYHADQRLKTFNYFILLLGALLVAYGTAMKEYDALANSQRPVQGHEKQEGVQHFQSPDTSVNQAVVRGRSYSRFAAAVAFCGFVISIAFFFIEIRGLELVTYGRDALDELEKYMPNLRLRLADKDRDKLADAIPKWMTCSLPILRQIKNWELLFTHTAWIRIIYSLAAFGFAAAGTWSLCGFK